MQPWAVQRGQCLFCSFGLSRLSLTNRSSRRLSPILNSRSLSIRKLKPRTDGPRASAREKHFDKNRDVLRRPAPVSENKDDSVEKFPERMKAVLSALEKKLKTTKIPAEETSQLEALDPDGQQWQRFQWRVNEIIEGKIGKGSVTDQKRLHKELGEIMTRQSWHADGLHRLHFDFIDQVLGKVDGQSPAVSNVLQKSSKLITDMRYPTEWYTSARATQREIHLHVGPTNSGKTYNALKRLEEAGQGFYAGPLRLLAHEVFTRFRANNIPCDLVTGDDVRIDDTEEAKIVASTVEMVNVSRQVDVAVIDEIQMMASSDRGWAWTRAFLGANAKEVHLCGETRVVPMIRELAASMGDTLHVHQYERLNPLKAMSKSLRDNLKNLRKGDCVVSFSILGIHALRKQIELDTGRRVAVVYGSLPPETRAQQAALFNDPDNDYDFLVASDAVGMGLNLSVKRIVFETVQKFNGRFREQLSIAQIKQIAGRAGRYRSARDDMVKQPSSTNPADQRATEYKATASVGLVTCLREADLPIIQQALNTEAPPIRAAGLLPPTNFVEDYAARLPKGLPFEYIYQRLCDEASLHPRFRMCDISDALAISKAIEPVHGLTIGQRCSFVAAPANYRTPKDQETIRGLARCVAEQRAVTVADIPELPLEILERPLSPSREYLEGLEVLHKSLILFLWLSYRHMDIFKDRDMALHAKELAETKINTCLLEFSANPALRRQVLKKRAKEAIAESLKQISNLDSNVSHGSDPALSEQDVADTSTPSVDWGRGAENAPVSVSGSQAGQALGVHG